MIEVQFSGGARVPPNRAVKGDLCYLSAVMHDIGTLNITASTRGYFLNKGVVPDGVGSLTLNFDAASPIFPTLMALFKARSSHFASRLEHRQLRVDGIH